MTTARRVRAVLVPLAAAALLLAIPASASAALGFLDQFGTAGSGPGQFDEPQGVDIAPNGNIYVADTGNDRIQVFDPEGNFVTQWDSFDAGSGQLDSPAAVSVDREGNVAVADTGNDTLHRFNPDGTDELIPPLGISDYDGPAGTESRSQLYFVNADTNHHRVVRVLSGKITIIGSVGTGPGEFAFPRGVAQLGTNWIYVADTNNNRIQRLSVGGAFELQIKAGSAGGFIQPHDVAVDPAGRVYVADTLNHRVQVFTAGGAPLGAYGSGGTGAGQFAQPKGIATDCHGNVYVADTLNDRIQKLGEPGNAKPPCLPDEPEPDPEPSSEPPADPAPAGGEQPPAGPPAGGDAPSRSPRLRILGPRKVAVRDGRVRLRLRCAASSSGLCAGSLTVRTARKSGGRRQVLARVRFRLRAGATRTVRLRLRRGGARLLAADSRSRRVVATAIVANPDGERVRVTKRLRLGI